MGRCFAFPVFMSGYPDMKARKAFLFHRKLLPQPTRARNKSYAAEAVTRGMCEHTFVISGEFWHYV